MKRNTLQLAVLPLILVLALGACQGQGSDNDDQAATPTAAVSGDGVALEPRDSIKATIQESPKEEPTEDASNPDPDVTTASDLAVEDCFNIPEGSQSTSSDGTHQVSEVDIVDCAEPHVYEAFAEGDVTTQNLPTEEENQAEAERICFPAFGTYVGADSSTSQYNNISYFSPTPLSWVAGDRRMLCILSLADESPTSGSAKGSGQ